VFYIVLLIIVLLGGTLTVLVIENISSFVTVTQLSFFVWQTPPLPIGLWLLISCLFGALLLYVVSVKVALQERRELRMLRQRVAELERSQAQVQARGPRGPMQAFPPPTVPMPGVSTGPLPPFPEQ
jgi:uncharacterized integral membrane protein